MQQTTKYQFKLIEGSDDFSPQPLNDNVEKVEEVLEDMAETVEAVQSTADAAFCPTNKSYVVGSYMGNNGTKTIELGFCPSFLIISGDGGSTSLVGHYQEYGDHVGLMSADLIYDTVTLTATGFKVVDNSDSYPRLNEHRTYIYIAFR